MSALRSANDRLARKWSKVGTQFLPFADIVTAELTIGRLLRLSLFQVTVGMAAALLIGTLNRVMIVELGLSASLVAVMVSAPLVFAPMRAVIGYRSDNHRSALGWRRVPYIFFGTGMQFGGFAIMPFALILLSGDSQAPAIVGQVSAGLAFLMVGVGLHTVQTAGLALATDLAPKHAQTKVVVLMCVMLLVGIIASSVFFGLLLATFTQIKLIQVVQGAGALTLILNVVAIWKQEPRDPRRTMNDAPKPAFREAWAAFAIGGNARRRLLTVGLGTAAFSMEDILLEPYGGQILHLSVGSTTALTGLLAVGGLAGLAVAARMLARKFDPYLLAAIGVISGITAFSAVIFAEPLESAALFGIGTTLIGFGAALFSVGTLMSTIDLAREGQTGLALGAWGAAEASAAGLAIAAGGILRDVVSYYAEQGMMGEALANPATGYSVVYHVEIALLFITLVALGPLVRGGRRARGLALARGASPVSPFSTAPLSTVR
jgi:BCD family chlorophyll transporter-like MFS transporter